MDFKLSIKPFEYFFDPAPLNDDYASLNLFPFLEASTREAIPGLEDSNCFNPRHMGLPWSTTFPAAVQSKYWRDAQEAATELFEKIRAAAKAKGKEMRDNEMTNEEISKSRDALLIDTAISAPMNMFPAANANQARILAKGNIFIFIHDDDVDCQSYGTGTNVLKEALEELQSLPEELERYRGPWKNPLFQEWVDECAQENFEAGLEFVQGALIWAKHTLDNPPKKQEHFSSWPDYVYFRIKDFMTIGVSGMLQLSCAIKVPAPERKALDEMYRLYMMHFSLTNDLYSYEKEMLEAKEEGVAIVNGVPVIAHLLNVSRKTAKTILRMILIDLENQLHVVYNAHVQSGMLNDRQLRYARSMIEGLSGNLFYSATIGRYARAIPGSHVMN
ncbi:isoprenoid synthase domain-containing protein [Penicillium vulpinum]|uniref:Isoprenoid synthase domain-containing protein n=1 Tax=Penicillium vulpinum TaxID=29845 RepID=A0A1V6RU35_9EURO|nr:isoprenoid synthase domain-containing protein [Penicillium vulpinum]KAJ5950696.1 isoprenoid synthase domain-containing protein [Penicillium vulpinum]OQE04999.1 hypothetical protein PENVUL_c028G07513 [Penicillium vulpinum]